MKNIIDLHEILFSADFTKFKNALKEFNINEKDNFGNNLLHLFIKESKNLEIDNKAVIDQILSKGLDINEKQSKGAFKRSALHIAVFMKLEEVTNYLIELGADVNSTDANGNSILWTAVMFYRDKNGFFIEKLIESNADIHLENSRGISAYSLAQTISNNGVRKFFD